jgi:hypothetical protein
VNNWSAPTVTLPKWKNGKPTILTVGPLLKRTLFCCWSDGWARLQRRARPPLSDDRDILQRHRATEAATVAKSKPKPDADRAGFEATLVYSVIAV